VASDLLPVAEARAEVLARVELGGSERIPLGEAHGRVLAADARAGDDVPAFDSSAMDGFAVRAADTETATPGSPARLRIAGESRAGRPAGAPTGPGDATRISTGAMIPEGADAVVRVEEANEADGAIAVAARVVPGRDVRRAGEDIAAGRTVVEAGTVMGPAELGVLASIGAAEVEASVRPRLAVVCTGDELLGPGEEMFPGGVRNSNAFTVPALSEDAGARLAGVERVGDDREATVRAIAGALEADVAVVCGGVSVGEHDHVKPALAELGAQEVFWGVALRPGRPTWFGLHGDGPARGGTLVFGLPGNPVSAYVTFVLFVRPALRALAGASTTIDRTTATLAEDVPRLPARDQAVRCALELTDRGWLATPSGPQGSHVLTSMLGADALATIEAGAEPACAGDRVEVELLPR
jgi:molybdopterin molybdotransferase